MFNLTAEEKKVLIALSIFAIIGLAVLGFKNYVARPQLKIVSTQLKSTETDYDALIKQKRTVNINAAGAKELERLPNIGPKLAKDIVTYRDANGSFLFKEDLMRVKGIGPKKFEELKDFITLE